MLERLQEFSDSEGESFFLWGPRQTGKSTLLKQQFPNAIWFDLLLSDVYMRLKRNPEIFRERILAEDENKTVVVDEIQRIPELLNEVHWLMVNHGTRFALSGSTPRKILRSDTNLLGGRALRYELFPFVSAEMPDFDLMRALNHGMLPRHYLAKNPKRLIAAYIGNYLKDEIVREARIRNMTVFSKFLEAAAFSNAEMVNYTNIATDIGVSSNTVKSYFVLLEEMLLGRMIPAYQKRPKRRVIRAPKFYYFDVGIVNYLLKRGTIKPKSELFGHAFEHFIYQEIYAHSQYSGKEYSISYWRTTSDLEVDFILGKHKVAIEVKGSENINTRHLKGLKAFMEEYKVKQSIIVCTEPFPRKIGNILILPWKIFLEKLWENEII